MFSITRQNKFPLQHGLHVQLYPMKQCDHSSVVIKKCSKCPLSAFTQARRRVRHWVTTALVTWSNLDQSYTNRIAQRGGRRHGFTCGRRAPAACPRLHSPPAWDQGRLEAIAKVIWNLEYHDSASRQSSHRHGELSMQTVRVNFM